MKSRYFPQLQIIIINSNTVQVGTWLKAVFSKILI